MKCWRALLLLSLALLGVACGLGQTARSGGAPAALRRADAAYQRGDYAEAILLYRNFLADDPDEDDVVQANYRLAASYHRLGRNDEAAEVLAALRAEYPEGQWPVVFTLYGDVEQARGHNVGALLWWERAYIAGDDNQRGILSARINALVDQMSDEERHQARPLSSTDFVWRALNSARRPTQARTAVRTQEPTPSPTPGPESVRIGVLVPLSGKLRSIGEASLDGARVAVERDEDLAPYDSLGSVGGALDGLAALQRDASAVAVVGPLRGEQSAAIVDRASSADIAVLPLSQSEGLSGPFVYQTAMTRSLQAQTLAAYAVRKLGLRRFAVVHPGDAYGMRLNELFREAVQSEGAMLVGAVAYQPGQTDFAATIEDLRHLDLRGRIEAVFLPDSAATIALLAPEVRRELPQMQLLGSSEWNEAAILAGVARSLEGAIFVDGFYPDSARPATRAFVEKFRRRFGRRPGLLEAQAHDATALVELAVRRGAFTRAEIDLMLQNIGLFEGAGGNLEIVDGVVRRQLFLLRFHDGDLEELSW